MNMAFAQVLNRIINRLFRESGIKAEMKDAVQDCWMNGKGVLKIGFGNLHGATAGDMFSAAPIGDKGERYEYDSRISPGMPWAKRVSPGNVVWPDGTRRTKDARWVAELIRRPVDDIRRDPRFKDTDGLHASSTAGEHGGHNEGRNRIGTEVGSSLGMVDLYEVRDFKYKRVFIIAPNAGHTNAQKKTGKVILDVEADTLQDRQLPYRDITFNPDSNVCWGIPFAQELETLQLEKNEISTQAMHHRRASMVKLIARKNSISESDKARMFSQDAGAIIETNGPPRNEIMTFQTAFIPQDLQIAEQMITTNVREIMGFSRNEMGEFQTRRGDTSAEEARNVHESAEVRLNEMRDETADLVVSVAEEFIEIIFDHWDESIVVDVVGPGGVPIWVKMKPSELKYGRYIVEVDPESAAPTSRAQREQNAMARYQLLSTNPMIDPATLTRYLLTEMDGVEMDDLMRQMPAVPGTGGSEAVGPGGLANIMQQGFAGANPGAQGLLRAGV